MSSRRERFHSCVLPTCFRDSAFGFHATRNPKTVIRKPKLETRYRKAETRIAKRGVVGCACWISGCLSGWHFRTQDELPPRDAPLLRPADLFSGLGFRVWSFRFRVSGFECRVLCLGFRVSSVECRVSGFGPQDASPKLKMLPSDLPNGFHLGTSFMSS
jgi:hypothetical protein